MPVASGQPADLRLAGYGTCFGRTCREKGRCAASCCAVRGFTRSMETEAKMNFEKRYDVIVAGAGIAGVAAALECSRSGCVIDATGDADVAYRSGAACVEGGGRLGIWAQELPVDPQVPVNTIWMDGSPEPVWHGTRGKEVTSFVLEGRKMLLERYKKQYAAKGPKWRSKLFPTALPAMA